MSGVKQTGTGAGMAVGTAFLILWLMETVRRGLPAPWNLPVTLLVFAGGMVLAYALGIRPGVVKRPEFGAGLMAFLAAWTILGTLVIQNREAAFYPARYGWLARPIGALSLDHVFFSGWFRGMLVLLGISLVLVGLERRSWMFRLIHLGVAVILLGGLVSDLFGFRGYMRLRPHQAVAQIQSQNRGRPGSRTHQLPFSVTLKEFHVDRYPSRPELRLFQSRTEGFALTRVVDPRRAGRFACGEGTLEILDVEDSGSGDSRENRTYRVRLRFRPGKNGMPRRFSLDSGSPPVMMPDKRHAILLRAVSPPREYVSFLEFRRGDITRVERVRVNHPADFGGYTFFQSGYRNGADFFSGITVKKDPGFPVVVFGLILFLAGLTGAAARRRP